jgi:hypothetical protein
MTTDDQFDSSISQWFEDLAPARLPDRVLDATFDRTRGIRQEAGWRTRLVTRPRSAPALIAAALLLAVALAMGGVAVMTSPPSVDLGIFEPVNGRIVYGSEYGIYGIEDGMWGLDPASSDPTSAVQLTTGPATPLGWSRDGTRLLVQKDGDSLVVLNADGSESLVTQPLQGSTLIGRSLGATISPDGSRVVFAGVTTPPGERAFCHDGALFAVNADGGTAEVIRESHEDRWVSHPTFSPDGTQIAFTDGNCDSDHGVWLMNADGSDAHQLVLSGDDSPLGASHVLGLEWSPAGDRIALAIDCYMVVDGGPCEGALYTFAPDGSDFRRVTAIGTFPVGAAYWSPDGSRIAYTTGCGFIDADDLAHECGFAISDADGSHTQTFRYGMPGPWHPGAPSPSVEPAVAPAMSPTVAPSRSVEPAVRPTSSPTVAPSPSAAPSSPPVSTSPQPTLEAVPAEYGLLDGEVTYRAAGPLAPSDDGYGDRDRVAIVGLLPDDDAPKRVLLMLADPRPIGPDCVVAPAPADASALAESIQSDSDFEATEPVVVTIAGISALQMDVFLAPGASSCPWSEHGSSGESAILVNHAPFAALPFYGDRARLYLLDLPGGSARVLAIAVIGDEDSFETVLGFAAPIVDSIEIHTR